MKRLIKCVRFEISHIKTSLAIFLLIYFGFYLLFFLLFCFSSGAGKGQSNFNLSFAADIFFFVMLSSTYSGFTNNLMIFGNTRKTIFASLSITCVLFSVVLALLSLLSDNLSEGLLSVAGIRSVSLTALVYGGVSSLETLFWVFGSMLLVSGLSLLYGSFNYRFGRTFRILFWISFGFIMMLVFNAGEVFHFLDKIALAAKWYFGYRRAHGVDWAGLHFAVTGAVFALIAYLFARRQPQTA